MFDDAEVYVPEEDRRDAPWWRPAEFDVEHCTLVVQGEVRCAPDGKPLDWGQGAKPRVWKSEVQRYRLDFTALFDIQQEVDNDEEMTLVYSYEDGGLWRAVYTIAGGGRRPDKVILIPEEDGWFDFSNSGIKASVADLE